MTRISRSSPLTLSVCVSVLALQTSTWDDQREAGVFLGVPLDPLAPELGKQHH